MLRLLRPVAMTCGMLQMQPLHFLQEDQVRPEFAQAFAQFVHHHAPVELRKTLVNIVGGDVQG